MNPFAWTFYMAKAWWSKFRVETDAAMAALQPPIEFVYKACAATWLTYGYRNSAPTGWKIVKIDKDGTESDDGIVIAPADIHRVIHERLLSIGVSQDEAYRFCKTAYDRRRALFAQAERERAEREEAERKRKLDEDIANGSPGQRSPESVSTDAAYDRVAVHDGQTYPASREYVARHKATGNLWACIFAVRDDDSDFSCSTNWYRVEPKTEERVVYARVQS